MILNHLILHHAHPGLLNGELRQSNTVRAGSERTLAEDLVDLLLGVSGINGLRLLHALHQSVKLCHLRGIVARGLHGSRRLGGTLLRCRLLRCHWVSPFKSSVGKSV